MLSPMPAASVQSQFPSVLSSSHGAGILHKLIKSLFHNPLILKLQLRF